MRKSLGRVINTFMITCFPFLQKPYYMATAIFMRKTMSFVNPSSMRTDGVYVNFGFAIFFKVKKEAGRYWIWKKLKCRQL
jgi:hypothetical protein